MATVRQLAQRFASQGVTQERFVELMSSFGIDPLDPESQDIEVGEQVASAPLLQGEGPQRGVPTGVQAQPDTPRLRPMQQRPLPYATDVQRPFEAPPGQAAFRAQTVERLPSAVAESMRQRPSESVGRTKRAYPMLSGGPGYQLAKDVGEAVRWAASPREDVALEQARELESGLNPYQRAAFGGVPERAAARGAASLTRIGSLPGVVAGAASSYALEGLKAAQPEDWASDQDMTFAGITLTPGERRGWDTRFAEEDMASVDLLDEIISDSVMRSETSSFAQNAVRSSLEFTEATFELLSWLSGGDIPKRFWENSSEADRKKVIADIVGPELLPGSSFRDAVDKLEKFPEISAPFKEDVAQGEKRMDVLTEEAVDRWPQFGRELVAFMSALFHQPYEVAHAHPIPVAALVYPIARRAGIKLGPKAADVGRRAYSALSKYSDTPASSLGGKATRATAEGAVSLGELINDMWSAFQRWKVDPTSVADPAMRPMTEQLIRGGSDVELGVANLGQMLEKAARAPGDEIAARARPEPVPEGAPPAAEMFTFRDVPGDELPGVTATRQAMEARRTAPPQEPPIVTREPLSLPPPSQMTQPVGRSAEAAAMGMKGPIWDKAFQSVMNAAPEQLRAISGEAFSGRAITKLDQAALAEAVAYLAEVASREAPAGAAQTRLLSMIRDAGGDPFKAASRQWNARNSPRGARPVGVYEAIPPEKGGLLEPIPDLPQVAATRQAMGTRRQAPPSERPAQPPDVRAGVEWERARAAVSEAEQSSRGLYERLDAARSEGLHKTNPSEYARMYDEAISTSHMLDMQARQAVELAKSAQADASPTSVPRSRALIPIEEVVAPEVINIPDRGPGQTYWPPKFRSPYEPPSLSPGLQPPPPGRSFGYQFDQKIYDLKGQRGKPRTLSPARESTPEGLVDVAPVTRDVTPVVQKINPETFRIIEDAAEWFESGPLREVPGFRQMVYTEVQAAIDTRLANTLQTKAGREGAAKLTVAELARRGRVKVDPKSVLAVLDEAKEGSINDVGIRYKDWQSGEPKVLSVVDVLSKSLELDPQFKEIVVSSMLNANMHRAATRARKLQQQHTMGKAIREWHPRHSTYEAATVDPAKGLVQMESAVKRRPPIDAELDFFKYRYEREGTLPPITRNPPESIIKYAEDNGIQVPGALRRRLTRMKKAPDVMLDALGLRNPDNPAGIRSVRISPMILDEGMTPELFVKSDLLSSLEWVFADRAWADGPIPILYGNTVENLFSGLSRGIKKGRVALNPSSLQAAGAANTMAATLKWGDPAALPKMVDWFFDMARYNEGLPTKRPKSHFEALIQSSDILDSSFTFELSNNKNLLDIAAGDSFVQRLIKRGNRAYDMPMDLLSRMFDKPDNIAKGWETMKKADRYLSDIAMLPEGKSIGVPIGRNVEVTLTKAATSKPGKTGVIKDGKYQLTEPQLLRLLMKSAAVDAARTYVNFRNVPLAQVAKRNVPLWDAVFGSPFSGWQSVTTTLPGRQGIVGEILSGPVNRGWTDYVPLMIKRQAEAAAHGAKIGSVIGSQAAQLDENSELFRLAAAWDLDEVKPVLTSPTDEAGVYDVWEVATSDPMEDAATTIRMVASATSPLEALAFIDPTAVSAIGSRGAALAKASAEDIAKMSSFERKMYKAALGMSSPRLRAMGSPWKRTLDSAYLGGSAIADLYMNFVKARGLPGGATDMASIGALLVKTSLRSYIPAYAGKTVSAYSEWVVPELEEKISGLAGDTTIPDLEKDEMIAEAQKELEMAKYMAGQKLVEWKPLEGGGSFERAEKDFLSILMDHWFNLPRPELMVGNESKSAELFKKMKSEALNAAGASSKKQIEAQEKQANRLAKQMISMPPGSPERKQVFDQLSGMRKLVEAMKNKRASLQQIIGEEFDARMRLLKRQTRNQKAMGKGVKRYMKDGLRVLNRSQRTKGKEYMDERYDRLDEELFPPGP